MFHLRQHVSRERPGLSYQATLPADDVVWSKPRHVSGQPIPIPPRNEPPLDLLNSTVVPGLSYQATLPADDVVWSKPRQVSGQPIPIPPRNEPPLLNSTVVGSAHFTGPLVSSGPTLSYQATLRADDVVWSEPLRPVSEQSTCSTVVGVSSIVHFGPLASSDFNHSYGGKSENDTQLEGERLKEKVFHLLTIIKLLTDGLSDRDNSNTHWQSH
jgi:hypothetical protein